MERRKVAEMLTFKEAGTVCQDTFRVTIKMRDPVNVAILKRTFATAIKRYPYFTVKLVSEGGELFLAPNDLPVVISNTDEPMTLGGHESNYHFLAVSWQDDTIFFDVYRGIAGKSGIYQLVKREPVAQSFTEFMRPHLVNLRDAQNPVAEHKAPIPDDPRALARHIKSFGYFMGADAVGICEVPEYAVYLDDPKGQPFENTYKYGIVLLKRKSMPTTMASTGRDRIFDACSHQAYQLLAIWTQTMTKYIRRLGYDALASNNSNYVTVMTSMVIAAGLGESCRMGFALNPFFGSNFKSACVLTNLPVLPDKPIDFGLKSYLYQKSCNVKNAIIRFHIIVDGEKLYLNYFYIVTVRQKEEMCYNIVT